MTASRAVQAHLSEIFPDKPIEQVDIPVDGSRFCPRPKNEKLLAEFGVRDDEPVAGEETDEELGDDEDSGQGEESSEADEEPGVHRAASPRGRGSIPRVRHGRADRQLS